ncbi:hypothetical protein [Alcanivorax limicola]|uniref:hypothetical protein n=1 Tax=Alcanivorax limicola TaxID=2874102 RepID=UPI001CC17409|nr:hypothetical protein [Alcanivorax limicola]
MRIYPPALMVALLASQANSEPMPWETEEYFESKRKAQQEHLSKFPIEMMLFLAVGSKPDKSLTGWIRLGEEHPSPLDPRVNIASVFNVSSGMKIGLNEGIIKDVFDYGIVIEENSPFAVSPAL